MLHKKPGNSSQSAIGDKDKNPSLKKVGSRSKLQGPNSGQTLNKRGTMNTGKCHLPKLSKFLSIKIKYF